MCDTIIALGNVTADGSVVFAKNSDREPNEGHELVIVPAANHPEVSQVKCTYISIPQVSHTYAVLLAKPTWIWGAEMGANEHGVVIGNEAVFTREPYQKEPGLIGMDFLRLALERSQTSRQAMDTIIQLLETYGQGGNCGFIHPNFYHNSFLIGDHQEAWVLETVGKQWAAVKVNDVRTISNAITIDREWDLASDGLVDYALERGWCKNRNDFSFARCYSDIIHTHFGAARNRQCRTTDMLRQKSGQITPDLVMQVLRDHRAMGDGWKLDDSLTGITVCMHAGYGPIRINGSVGSMVSHLTQENMTHWLTGTAGPCTSVFKPVWLDAGLPDMGKSPEGIYDPQTLYWRHEVLHRSVLLDHRNRMNGFAVERDDLERRFVAEEKQIRNCSQQERLDFTTRCFHEADKMIPQWVEKVQSIPVSKKPAFYFSRAWDRFNREAKMPPLK